MTDSCARRSRGRAEDLHGTASRARRWVLLEQPGAWGRDALRQSDLPPDVAAHLQLLSRQLPARVLLLRRPHGERPVGTERTLIVGRSEPGGSWLERIVLPHVSDLLDLPLDGVATGATIGGERVLDPLYLVCTNGKHDACCAEYGLPVARTLADLLDDRVWECSHVGGDRFAANVVCLPAGIFYGHLDPDAARSVVAAHEGGRMLLERLRGRSSLPFPAQAAESLARRALGLQRLDALRFVAARRDGDDHQVRFDLGDGRGLLVTLREGRDEPRQLTCNGHPVAAPTYDLLALETADVSR